jgi:hypothetical protein
MKKKKAHTAHVTLTVARSKDFKAVPGGAYTKCKVTLRENTGRVESRPDGGHAVHDCGIGPVVFKVGISPRGSYLPAGIAFEHTKALKGSKKIGARHVRENFPAAKVFLRGGVLEFTDECKSVTAGHSFEYYVLIQRRDGALGIIDPGIHHDPPN